MNEVRGVQSSVVTSTKGQTLGPTSLSRIYSHGNDQEHTREIGNASISLLVPFHDVPECGHVTGAALLDQCRYRQIGLCGSVDHIVDVGQYLPSHETTQTRIG